MVNETLRLLRRAATDRQRWIPDQRITYASKTRVNAQGNARRTAWLLALYMAVKQTMSVIGANEDTNGLLRQKLPKGTDLSVRSKAYLTKWLVS
jgi:hypothetical protein